MTLCEYLTSLDCVDVAPIRLKIGKTTYEGARYRQNDETRERIYLLGELPREKIRREATCFRFENDSRDWYVACYMPKENFKPENARFHPFGINFMLMPWDISEPIDRYNYWRGEHKPYTRVAINVI